MQLFGTSGIRRIADIDLVRLAFQVGLAVGATYSDVVIGRDTRVSGSALRHAVTAGILTAGARCSDAGVLPTPTLGYIAREFKAAIMITASHNPPQYNGLKLLNPDGSAFSAQQQKQIEEIVNGTFSLQVTWDRMQTGEVYSTAIEKHVARIMQAFPGGIKLKVVVDAGCGAAYFITPHVLTRLGCEVTAINCYADGIFPHDVEPVEANLGGLMSAVRESGADLGIAHDGDADRMMAVDERGKFISGDKLLVIFAQSSGSKKIITTVDASMVIEEMGYLTKRTRVGDPYVSEELKKKKGGFGGEPSGAWVFPQVSLCPDGIYAAAQIAAIAGSRKMSEIVDSIPSYPIVRGSITGSLTSLDIIKPILADKLNPVSINTVDGLKLSFKDGWLLLRPSGTEPKVRFSAEARTEKAARRYYEKGTQIILEHLEECRL